MTATTSSSLAPTRRFGLDRLFPRALAAVVVAILANLVVYVVARGLFDVSFVMPYEGMDSTPKRLPAAMVAIVSGLTAVVAAALFWALDRFGRRPLTVFRAIAGLVLLVSFGGPLSLDDTSTSTRVALIVMHVVAAAAIVGLLTTSAWRTRLAR